MEELTLADLLALLEGEAIEAVAKSKADTLLAHLTGYHCILLDLAEAPTLTRSDVYNIADAIESQLFELLAAADVLAD